MQIEDASYCTNLSARSPRSLLQRALKRIFDEIAGEIDQGHNIKKLYERLSHISLDWFKEEWNAETNDRRVIESVADIAVTAGIFLAREQIQIEDSREFVVQIIKWSEEFNAQHKHSECEDVSYIESTDNFAETKILELYGSEKEERAPIEVVISDESRSDK